MQFNYLSEKISTLRRSASDQPNPHLCLNGSEYAVRISNSRFTKTTKFSYSGRFFWTLNIKKLLSKFEKENTKSNLSLYLIVIISVGKC